VPRFSILTTWLKGLRSKGVFGLQHGPTVLVFSAMLAFAVILGIVLLRESLIGESEPSSEVVRNTAILAAVPISILLAVWRNSVATSQAESAQNQAEIARQSLLNERYQKATEMLSDASLMVRLGGIYALQRLAMESSHEHLEQIMRLLAAFVRRTRNETGIGQQREPENRSEETADSIGDDPRTGDDVAAALDALLSVVGTRKVADGERQALLDLRGANLIGVNLNGADLRFANLAGADLSGSSLLYANLSYAILERANLSFLEFPEHPEFPDFPSIDFTRCNLNGARMHKSELFNACLVGSSLHNAIMTDAVMYDSVLTDAELIGTDLRRCDLRDSRLGGVLLMAAKLEGADISGAAFVEDDPRGGSPRVAYGLTQDQLSSTEISFDNPPILEGYVEDWKTEAPLHLTFTR